MSLSKSLVFTKKTQNVYPDRIRTDIQNPLDLEQTFLLPGGQCPPQPPYPLPHRWNDL